MSDLSTISNADSTDVIQPVAAITLSRASAERLVIEIKAQLDGATRLIGHVRQGLVKLYDGQGWLALGYPSWRACVAEQFGTSAAQLYRELKAAHVEQSLSPTGGITGELPETHARELPANDPVAQAMIMTIAKNTAPGKKVTASHIRAVVTVIEDIVLTGAMDDGSGVMKPLGMLMDAAVTEEAYERLMRQKQALIDAGLNTRGKRVLNAAATLMQARDGRALFRIAPDAQTILDTMPADAEYYLVAYVKNDKDAH